MRNHHQNQNRARQNDQKEALHAECFLKEEK